MVPAEASFSVLAQALVVSALTLAVQIYLYELSSFCLEFRLRNRGDFQLLASLSITEWFMSFTMSDEHSLASVLVDGFGSLQLCLGDFVSWSVPLAAALLMVFLDFSLAFCFSRPVVTRDSVHAYEPSLKRR